MTAHEIVALRCPSCGGGFSHASREMPFGAEFRCGNCTITSVLIIDRALVPLSALQKQGEQVCVACGRIERREARFCQEGHALVKACVHCGRDFAVDHERCDYCGRTQDLQDLMVDAKRLLANGKRAFAVKLVCETTGLGVAEAMDMIKSWEKSM